MVKLTIFKYEEYIIHNNRNNVKFYKYKWVAFSINTSLIIIYQKKKTKKIV